MQQLPFSHGNLALAVSLHVAGASIVDVFRLYTKADEKKYDARCSELAKKDIGGRVVFSHNPIPNLSALIAAFDEQKETEQYQIEPFDMVAEPQKLDALQARIACLALQVRKQLTDILRDPKSARIAESNGEVTTSEAGGVKLESHPGFRMCSDSDKLRKELGL